MDFPANSLGAVLICRVMHFFDGPRITAGFGIERLKLFARPDYPADIRLDGRESVGLIAVKK